ncbi:hypothetical protein MML48_5g00009992 [Holotrichia oblita]|uniref:Uncharacterized protein n=1 Tax=Holotrichia oblita TaxID=644536 RepID=A0ACB9T156_HOLOL|nr:hypothetical protein MML48_5g00009992 [Holotrichia oblita]
MDNVIFRNICHEIMRECHNKGVKISKKFSAYYVKLLLLNPKWNISLCMEDINRIDLQNLVKYALECLMQENAPSIIALKMQMYFSCSFDTSSNIIVRHRNNLKDKLIPLENEICAFREGDDAAKEKLFKKIVYYLTLFYGLGDPTDAAIYKEAHQGLKSIFFPADLDDFIVQTQFTKVEQLQELACLLAGVRLFNRDCNKGGKGIEDIPMLLTHAIDLTKDELQETLIYVMANVNIITTALDNAFLPVRRGVRTVLDLRIPQVIEINTIEYAKDMLVCYRQFEVYIRKMQVEMEKLDDKAQCIFDDFQWCLIEVHQCVQYKTAVPASAVYPLFRKLAQIWHTMQNMVVYLSRINQTLINLQTYIKKISPIDDQLKILIGDTPIMTDVERLNVCDNEEFYINKCFRDKIVKPDDMENFDDITLQFLGFCIWKFVESQGCLIPGNPDIGVIEIEKRYYVFCNKRAAQAFILHPKRYIYEALDIIRRKPELAHFLDVYDQLESVRNIKKLVTVTVDTKVTHEIDTQTDIHPCTMVKVKDYMWNVWDLKRKALSMADTSKRQTHSTQTLLSNNRNSLRVQTHFTKDHCYQTKTDNYSNVPIQSNYIFGLRGRKDDRQFIITLTRPVEE